MPNKRDTTRTIQCAACGQSFHPWLSTNGTPRFCSARCRSLGTMAAINGVTLDGAPLPVRKPASAIPATVTTATVTGRTAPTAEEIGREWRESGEHWQRVTEWLSQRQEMQRRRQAQADEDAPYRVLASEGRTITLHGYGAGLFVKNGQLHVTQGRSYSTEPVHDEMLSRGLHGVSTLVWITNGGAGSLSIQAIKWCAQQAITLVILTERGECLGVIHPSADAPTALGIPGRGNAATSRAGRSDVALRRAQYLLASSGRDIEVARQLLHRKIAAQRQTAQKHQELPNQARALEATSLALEWLGVTPPTPFLSSLVGLRVMEAKAARGYFASWVGLPLRVDAKARSRWPAPWLMVAERNSPLTRWHSARSATNPGQAMLNFAYSLLESQVRAALNVIGADQACGVMHADLQARDSCVFDLMEPLRGPVDDLLLSFWQQHTFSPGDFAAQTSGAVLIHPSLCRVLVEECRLPQRRVDDEARWLRELLLDAALTSGANQPPEPSEPARPPRPTTRRKRH
jgi:CRISPR-associated endonuclease Cas1